MSFLDKAFPLLSHDEIRTALEDHTSRDDRTLIIMRAQRALTLRQVAQHIRENRLFQDKNSLLVANLLDSLMEMEGADEDRNS